MRKALVAFFGLTISGAAIGATAWSSTDPSITNGQHSDFFPNDLRVGWKDGVPSAIYWVRLRKTADAFEVVEVSPRPIARESKEDEVLVVDVVKRRAHPAYEAQKQDYDPRRRAACEKPDIVEPRPYTVCNSAFAEPPSGAARVLIGILSGGQSEANLAKVKGQLRIYEPSKVADVVRQTAFEDGVQEALPAATRAREHAIDLADASKRAAAAENQERLRMAAQAEANERAAIVAKLKRLRVGYKDVCQYSLKLLDGAFYTTTERLKCINLGEVPSLEALKEAGFIVTNLQERQPGERSTTVINVEKFE